MNKTRRSTLRLALAATAMATGMMSGTATAQANAWPNRPIRLIVPSAAGGAADFVARTFSAFLQKRLPANAAVVVENRPGAGGIIGTEAAKSAPADGYTFLIASNSTHAANVSLYRNLPYDPIKDFAPVGMFGTFGTILVVPKNSPFKSLPELIRYAKAHPGNMTYGYYSSSSRVPPELLRVRAGLDYAGAPYRNITQIITDMLGGQIQFAFLDSLSAAPALQNPMLAPIAVTSSQRMPQLASVPTVAESLQGFEVQGWLGLTAPAGTPEDVVKRMSTLVSDAISEPAIRTALERQGMAPRTMTPEALRAHMVADRSRWAEWTKAAGIEPE
ncbi:Bug family tripartite tricarboxylate transporter substrate binding protein [Cupriavidus metallidurans]|uniref:Extra-cytoplasmic solute receptor n=2 Tax=Cupriavidus metallidurans TaxID=119219 RepID=Q1LFG7_CUPMC|nr:tripartite tricarboxylate transporter substrate binding protein [Cupriavidus metallidurans]ABF11109.1 Extra-cytoplasmic solute receptor [Cupriavidus metallidurans CH34]